MHVSGRVRAREASSAVDLGRAVFAVFLAIYPFAERGVPRYGRLALGGRGRPSSLWAGRKGRAVQALSVWERELKRARKSERALGEVWALGLRLDES